MEMLLRLIDKEHSPLRGETSNKVDQAQNFDLTT